MRNVTGTELLEPANPVDEVRLFLLYAMFGGDCRRVSAVSQVDVRRIESLAFDFGWKAKLSGRPGVGTEKGAEEERVLNRVANFVTSERLRRVFARLIDELDSDPSFARSFCTTIEPTTQEKSFNTKNLVELAKGLQIVTDISYRALQDRQAQAIEVSGKADTAQLALQTYKALAARFDHIPVVDPTTEIAKAVDDSYAEDRREK